MSRGSFRLRLPRGRHSLKAGPILMGLAVFLVILVPTLFYLFPHAPDSQLLDSDLQVKSKSSPEPVLRVASSDASLLASVESSSDFSQVYLENTGTSKLHQVKVLNGEKALGTLSELVPGEKKVLAVSGSTEGITVSALDQSGQEIMGQVHYNSTEANEAAPEDAVLSTKAVPEVPVPFSGPTSVTPTVPKSVPTSVPTSVPVTPKLPAPVVPPIVEKPAASTHSPSSLSLNISVNRSEGLQGDIVSYRCKAVNVGPNELSDVRIICAGKMSATWFLPPNEELDLEGVLLIENNTELTAGAEGKDANGTVYTNNTSIAVRMISPLIKLEVQAPDIVHRGDKVDFQIRVENSGNEMLTNLSVSDSFGEIGQIDAINPGAFQVLRTERVISQSQKYEVTVVAPDGSGNELSDQLDDQLYASQSLNLRVRNSSLQISGDPAEVRTYPGRPVGVTWILSNTGEERLKNITLAGDGKRLMLAEIPPGQSVRMAAIYAKNATTWINVTARGVDENGFEANATACVLLKSIQPGINLKVMPTEIEVCPGDTAEISSLVTNSGDDRLLGVVITQNGSTLATIGSLEPGEFRVVDSRTVISSNCTIQFAASGKDSSGKMWSDEANVKARAVVTALRVFASASPPAVVPGERANLTCTVANTGSVPLYSIFVISKNLGPLGNIDYLSPKHQKVIYSEKAITNAGTDTITAEGFTQDKKPVRGSCSLDIGLMGAAQVEGSDSGSLNAVKMTQANISCGNLSLPFNLPDEKETISQISGTMARDIDHSATRSNNAVIDGISNLLRYVETLLGMSGKEIEDKTEAENANENENVNENVNENKNESESHAAQEFAPRSDDSLPAGKELRAEH